VGDCSAELGRLVLEQSLEVVAQFGPATAIVGQVHQFVGIVVEVVPLVVVIIEVGIGVEAFPGVGRRAGAIDPTADAVVPGVLGVAIARQPSGVPRPRSVPGATRSVGFTRPAARTSFAVPFPGWPISINRATSTYPMLEWNRGSRSEPVPTAGSARDKRPLTP